MPLVCLSLTGRTIAENLAVLDLYRGLVDLVELRADFLAPEERFRVREFPRRAGLPCVLTVRRAADGGAFTEGEGVRLVTIAKALAFANSDRVGNFAYVDLESDFRVPAIEEACRIFGTRIIRSYHSPCSLPHDLRAVWQSLAEERDEIPKLSIHCASATELAVLLGFAAELPARERIIVGMGDHGFPSRLLAARLGSMLSYASALEAGLPEAAPGHVDPESLVRTYRHREIGPGAELYALAGGRSVVHSRSPQLHNPAFRAAGMEALYFPVPAESASAFMALADFLRLRGASVTVPHKETVLPFLSELSPEAALIGAANTLLRTERGWKGFNTDAVGFQRAVAEFLGRSDLAGLRVTLVGAGGAARAIAYALARLGAACLVVNRSSGKAKALARAHGFAWAPCDERSAELVADHADLVVNATTVGMDGGPKGDPLEWYDFSGREAVVDIVYRPERTPLLHRARAAGCRVMNGLSMLRHQAAEQFRIWTGREPPGTYFE